MLGESEQYNRRGIQEIEQMPTMFKKRLDEQQRQHEDEVESLKGMLTAQRQQVKQESAPLREIASGSGAEMNDLPHAQDRVRRYSAPMLDSHNAVDWWGK